MLDASKMYPKGFHPLSPSFEPDFKRVARPFRRRGAGVKYYFIDFGFSQIFNSYEERENVLGIMAQDRTIPELSNTVPYDPFAVDVYTLGMVYKERLTSVRVSCPKYL